MGLRKPCFSNGGEVFLTTDHYILSGSLSSSTSTKYRVFDVPNGDRYSESAVSLRALTNSEITRWNSEPVEPTWFVWRDYTILWVKVGDRGRRHGN